MNGKQFWLGLLGCSLLFGAGCGIKNQSVTSLVSSRPASAEDTAEKKKYVLGEFSVVSGTDYLAAPVYIDYSGKGRTEAILSASDEYSGAKGAKGGGVLVNNYVFVNQKDLSSRKLLPNNKSVILDEQQYGEMNSTREPQTKAEPAAPKPKNIKSVLYRVVNADTNGDKSIDGRDKKTISIADADGSNYKELVPGMERILKIHNPSKNKQVVFYQTGSDFFVASIDIPGRSAQVNKLQSIAE
jgi:hypothetical protein